jgi:hypothetical protein
MDLADTMHLNVIPITRNHAADSQLANRRIDCDPMPSAPMSSRCIVRCLKMPIVLKMLMPLDSRILLMRLSGMSFVVPSRRGMRWHRWRPGNIDHCEPEKRLAVENHLFESLKNSYVNVCRAKDLQFQYNAAREQLHGQELLVNFAEISQRQSNGIEDRWSDRGR